MGEPLIMERSVCKRLIAAIRDSARCGFVAVKEPVVLVFVAEAQRLFGVSGDRVYLICIGSKLRSAQP